MVIVGIDAHTQSHTAAAIDEHGRELATLTVGACPAELARLLAWIDGLGEVGLVAIEGAKGFGLPITRRILVTGVEVIDVPTHLTSLGRRSSRSRGKDDPADAVTIARMALREPGLPRLRASHLASDLKLLVEARDQLVAEGTRIRNRLHALLTGYERFLERVHRIPHLRRLQGSSGRIAPNNDSATSTATVERPTGPQDQEVDCGGGSERATLEAGSGSSP